MKKGFKIKFDIHKLIFWLVLSGVSFILLLLIAVLVVPASPEIPDEARVPDEISQELVEVRYRADIKNLMQEFSREAGNLDGLTAASPYLEITKKAKNQALELFVPADLKSMHLDIVVSLNYLENGFSGDEDKLNLGRYGLKKVLTENSWLLNK